MMKRPTLLALPTIAAALAVTTWLGCGRRADLDTYRDFDSAQSAFEQARTADDFRKSAAAFEQLADSGMRCGAVYYNLGNAYMRAGERGRAIAAYRQAQPFMPSDPRLEANLAYAQGIENGGTRRPLAEHVLFWQNWISYHAKARIGLFCGAITLLLAVVAIFHPRHLRAATIGALAVTLLVAVSVAYDWHRFDHVERGVIVTPDTVARKGNMQTYEPAFTEPLPEGTEFRITDRRGSWLRIRLPEGGEGWIEQADAVVY